MPGKMRVKLFGQRFSLVRIMRAARRRRVLGVLCVRTCGMGKGDRGYVLLAGNQTGQNAPCLRAGSSDRYRRFYAQRLKIDLSRMGGAPCD